MNPSYELCGVNRLKTTDMRFAALLIAKGFMFIEIEQEKMNELCNFVISIPDKTILELLTADYKLNTAMVNAGEHSKAHTLLRTELKRIYDK